MTTTARTRLAAALAAATLGLTGCGFHGLYSANLPGGPNVGSHPYDVTIDFADVLDLVPQSNVKVDDVAVGKVVAVKLVDWHAQVTVQVNGAVHLPSNARAAIKMTSLLGEKYVDLEQPVDSPPADTPLGNGSHIPLTATGTAPEVEEVLGALSLVLNGGGLQQIRTITTELNKALKGNESSIKDLLTQLNGFVGQLDRQKGQITHALDQIDTLTKTLNAQRKSITDALDTFPQALQILASERGKLVTLLQSLATLGSTTTDLLTYHPRGDSQSVQNLFVDGLQKLQPVLEQLVAAGDDLPNALKMLLTFPFPIGKATDFLKGDYANLGLHLDFNVTDNLCGLQIQGLCSLVTGLTGLQPGQVATSSGSSIPPAAKAGTATGGLPPVQLPGLPATTGTGG